MKAKIRIEQYSYAKHGDQVKEYLFNNIKESTLLVLTGINDLQKKEGFNFVALEGENVIGFLFGSIDQYAGRVSDLCVFKNYRKKGIGKTLLETFYKYVRFKNTNLITLVCLAINSKGCEFYKKQGFKKVGFNNYANCINGQWHKGYLFAKDV